MLRLRYDPARYRSRTAQPWANAPAAAGQGTLAHDAPARTPAHPHARGQTPFDASLSRGAIARQNLRFGAL